MTTLRIGCAAFGILALAFGCGDSNGRQVIAGKVTYDGQPLVYGQITFDPDSSKGHKGPQGAGEIRDGVYKTNPDYGPVAGPHVVRITGWNTKPDQGMLGPPLVSEHTVNVDITTSSSDLNFDIPAVKKKGR